MGLDQYLEARKYVSRYDLSKPYDQDKGFTESDEFSRIAESLPLGLELYGEGGAVISVNVAYWHKAYAIHDYISQSLDDRFDNWVSREFLETLLRDVETVLADHSYASQLIPDHGAIEADRYDENYYKQLEYTQKALTHLLGREAYEDLSFYYNASW